jgi:L-threonylcarbamoyladenylate synthase
MVNKHTARIELSAKDLHTPAGQQVLLQSAEILLAGGTVAFATETVYGLGANAFNASAVEKIFAAKQRPAWDPLIVHISSAEMLERVAMDVSLKARRLMDAFWPGPLTLLLPKQAEVPLVVTAGRPLVAVRMPAHPVAQALIAAAGVPLAAPSANRFGYTSPTTAQHVMDDMDGRIDLVLDSGAAWCGIESTVIEVGFESVVLYRPGAVTAAEIEAIAGPVTVHQAAADVGRKVISDPESLPSPGVGIRHYAPRAQLLLVDMKGIPEALARDMWAQSVRDWRLQEKMGVMLPAGWPVPPGFLGFQYPWGNWNDKDELAQHLFAGLRALDAMGADLILCPLPAGDTGLGPAIRDRLLKAARKA